MRKISSFCAATGMLVGLPGIAWGRAVEPEPATARPTTAPNVAEDGLEDIVVTARRREERLQNVPIAISALSAAMLESRSIVQLKAVAVPGMNIVSSNRGESNPSVAIRGQRAQDLASYADPPVTIYFDEVGQARATGANQLMFDLESIQVLKGPQGTLFGRNTIGGAVVITSHAPTDAFEGYIRGTLGNYRTRELEGVVNLPLSETLAVRFAGKTSNRDGYLTNLISGERLNDRHNVALRGSAKWQPSNNFVSTVIGSYFRNRSNGDAYKLARVDTSRVAASTRPALTALYNNELAASLNLGRREFRSSITDFYARDTVWSIQNNSILNIGPIVMLKNIVSYRDIKSSNYIDNDGSFLRVVDFPVDIANNQFSNEFQVSLNFTNLDIIAGLFYFHEKSTDLSGSSDRYGRRRWTRACSPHERRLARPATVAGSRRIARPIGCSGCHRSSIY